MGVGKLAGFSIRLDPWSADYGASLLSTPETEALLQERVRIDTSVEMNEPEWRPIDCSENAVEQTVTVAFVDGVRRIESNLIFETNSGFLYGAFGACAAGGVVLQPGQLNAGSDSFAVTSVKRYLFAPAELPLEDTIYLPLHFPEGASIPVNVHKIAGYDPAQPLAELQQLMRQEEASVTDILHASGESKLVIADGPLNLILMKAHLAGFIKSLHSLYLPPFLYSLLPELRKFERTPMFLIETIDPVPGAIDRYGSYVRIGEPGPQQSSLAGIARLEVSGDLEIDAAIELLNACGAIVPKYASQFGRDPRAPQNLIPLSFVETELRRLMGNSEIIKRLFMDWLQM
jgi:hypothetical protein